MHDAAIAIGMELLARLGIRAPRTEELNDAVDLRLGEMDAWISAESLRLRESAGEATDQRVIGAAKIMTRMMPPSYFRADHGVFGWLILESMRLWAESGASSFFVGPISHACFLSIERRGDYRLGYRISRHVLNVCDRRGYDAESSLARFLFALGSSHWFDPMDESIAHARAAHAGLVCGGDLQNACFTFYASIPHVLQSAPTLEEFSAEVDAGIAFSRRTGNDQAGMTFGIYRQFARVMRGETNSLGAFADDDSDEAAYLESLGDDANSLAYHHIVRSLAAIIFDRPIELSYHATQSMRYVSTIIPMSTSMVAHWTRAAANARRLRTATPDERVELLREIDASRDVLARRAADAPTSYLHSVHFVDAERAWALDDFASANAAFQSALRQVQANRNPRHHALVSERAALFYLENGLDRYGHLLLVDARDAYRLWGAQAKIDQLELRYPFLASDDARAATRSESGHGKDRDLLSVATFDGAAILRASQALSSETSLDGLRAKIFEVLAALTGATSVRLVLRRDDDDAQWTFSSGLAHAESIPLRAAEERGLLPLSTFRYVERTHETLVLPDVKRDDRFARDPYFSTYDRCSALVVPITKHGSLRAVLMLENDLGCSAFTSERLDVVALISGQLAVSLDNALLYESLERKVLERTKALATANMQLAALSSTDALTGILNRRGFDLALATECKRARRERQSIGLLMIDVDEFKKYNDHFGHLVGDACLHDVAQSLREGLRLDYDLIARYGGEEFVVVLPRADMAAATFVAERVRAAVEDIGRAHPRSAHGVVTVSIGVSAFVPRDDADATTCLEAADAALYVAKKSGRNRVAQGAARASRRVRGLELDSVTLGDDRS